MRALLSHVIGGPQTLRLDEIADPVAGPGELLVRVRATAINYPDVLIIEDKYQMRPPRPFAPGSEIAGGVEAVGEGVEGWSVGDRLIAVPGFGGLAEKIVVPANRAFRLPASRSFAEGSALLMTYGTSIYALYDRGRLEAGQSLLVLGAAGGVGTAAIELAKVMGARVIAAASSEAKLAVCRRLGADAVVDYATEPLRDRLKELTGGKGVDVVYDPVGGAYAEVALRGTGWDGRYLVIGFAAGEVPKVPLNLALLNARSILGVYWGEWTKRHRAASEANFAQLAGWITGGKLHPEISERLPLEEVPRAMMDLVERRALGKLLVVP